MNKTEIILWEQNPSFLSIQEANDLEDVCRDIWRNRRLSPTYGKAWRDQTESTDQAIISFNRKRSGDVEIIPQKYIGTISVNSIQYLILPKIYKAYKTEEIAQFLSFQFEYAQNLKMPDTSDTESETTPLTALFTELQILKFARRLLKLLHQTNHLDYQEIEANIQTIRGRIDFSQHIRHNDGRGRHDRIYCRYEVYQEDNLLLRIVKHVCRVLAVRTRVFESRRIISEIFSILDTISDKPCSYNDTLRVKLNYYQQDFKIILNYCKMFLSFRMADSSSGDYGMDYVLINTADLFESFVTQFLKKNLPQWEVKAKKTSYMANDSIGKLFQYENDFLLVNKENNRVIIGDSKYKEIDLKDRSSHFGISHSDLYQMISYAIHRASNAVILVYPGTGSEGSHNASFTIKDSLSGKDICITAIKIRMDSDSPKEILECFKVEGLIPMFPFQTSEEKLIVN